MPMLRDASRTKLLSKKLGMNRIHSVPDAEPSRCSHAAAPPPLVVDLTMGLSVGRLNAYWLRDVLAVDLAFEQDALSLIHISEPTRLGMNSYAVFCLKK